MEMENEHAFDEILIRYFSNETTEAEAETIENWINASEANRLQFLEWQRVWRLITLEKEVRSIDIDNEWKAFREKAEDDDSEGVIIDMPARNTAAKWWMAAAVAAALLLFAGIRMNWFGKTTPAGDMAQTEKPAVESQQLTRYERNNSGEAKRLSLSDGSEVVLYDSSEIVFLDRFEAGRRRVDLNGKAEFIVAKDSSRPFTVISGDLATTALGTKFLVENRLAYKNIVVQLFEGRVVVRSVDSATRRMSKDVYLRPGQELIYNRRNATAISRRFRQDKGRPKGTAMENYRDNPSIPSVGKGNWYMFNNESLASVFEQLESMYNVRIRFSKQDLQNMYFIGTFDKADSLEKVLKQIAMLNNLKLVVENNEYILSK